MTIKEMQKQRAAAHRFSIDLYAAKEATGMSLVQLGAQVGLSGNQVRNLLKDPDKMSLAHLRQFCNVLKIPYDNFLIGYGLRERTEL